MKRILLGLFICWNFLSLSAQTNIDISNSAYFDGEPFMAVNPADAQNIVVAWMGISGLKVTIKTICSFDGGLTWGNVNTLPHFGTYWGAADPAMCFESDGTVYLAYIDFTTVTPQGGAIYVANSTNGGVSWSTPVMAFDMNEDPGKAAIDRPWMVIDNSAASTSGNLYLTTKPAYWIPAPNRPYLKRSTDGGQTWDNYRYVDSTGFLVGNLIQEPMPAPAVTADGLLKICYPSYLASQSPWPRLLLATSANAGDGFDYDIMYQNVFYAPDTNLKQGYHLAASPADPMKMAFCFVDAPNGDADIYCITTSDGGSTWTVPVRVNDDAVGNGVLQDLSWCSYDALGKLCVTWRDRRNAPSTGFFQPNDFYAAVSTDNGQSFQANLKLSTVTADFDSILIEKGNDFMGCAFMNDTIYAVWGDTRSGNLEIYFSKCSVHATSAPEASVISKEEIFNLFPVPANDELKIKWNIVPEGDMKYFIEDMQGKVIKSFDGNAEKLDVSGIPDGNYIFEVKTDEKVIRPKFSILH